MVHPPIDEAHDLVHQSAPLSPHRMFEIHHTKHGFQRAKCNAQWACSNRSSANIRRETGRRRSGSSDKQTMAQPKSGKRLDKCKDTQPPTRSEKSKYASTPNEGDHRGAPSWVAKSFANGNHMHTPSAYRLKGVIAPMVCNPIAGWGRILCRHSLRCSYIARNMHGSAETCTSGMDSRAQMPALRRRSAFGWVRLDNPHPSHRRAHKSCPYSETRDRRSRWTLEGRHPRNLHRFRRMVDHSDRPHCHSRHPHHRHPQRSVCLYNSPIHTETQPWHGSGRSHPGRYDHYTYPDILHRLAPDTRDCPRHRWSGPQFEPNCS